MHSGYRTEKTNKLLRRLGYHTARNSYHPAGRTVDFSLPSIPTRYITNYANWLKLAASDIINKGLPTLTRERIGSGLDNEGDSSHKKKKVIWELDITPEIKKLFSDMD